MAAAAPVDPAVAALPVDTEKSASAEEETVETKTAAVEGEAAPAAEVDTSPPCVGARAADGEVAKPEADAPQKKLHQTREPQTGKTLTDMHTAEQERLQLEEEAKPEADLFILDVGFCHRLSFTLAPSSACQRHPTPLSQPPAFGCLLPGIPDCSRVGSFAFIPFRSNN